MSRLDGHRARRRGEEGVPLVPQESGSDATDIVQIFLTSISIQDHKHIGVCASSTDVRGEHLKYVLVGLQAGSKWEISQHSQSAQSAQPVSTVSTASCCGVVPIDQRKDVTVGLQAG